MKRKATYFLLVAFSLALFAGCLPLAEEEFKNALPLESDLKIVMGESDPEEGAPKAWGDCEECCIDDESGGYVDADTYVMTRSAIYHVNGTLVVIYGWFAHIVASPYSEQLDNGYIWGPWDDTDVDPLTRLEYRFKMTQNSDSSFNYGLETRLINDEDGEWEPCVFGDVTPTDEPHKGVGTMTIDFDVLHELDSAHPTQFHGRVDYEFDVRQVSPTEENPNSVTVTFVDFWEDPDWGQEPSEVINADYLYERYEALAGKLEFLSVVDFTGPDDEPDGLEENFDVISRWTGTGKGLGTATVSGGSLDEMAVDSYTLTECWAEADLGYWETYDLESLTYTDGQDPLEELNCGDESHCPVFD